MFVVNTDYKANQGVKGAETRRASEDLGYPLAHCRSQNSGS